MDAGTGRYAGCVAAPDPLDLLPAPALVAAAGAWPAAVANNPGPDLRTMMGEEVGMPGVSGWRRPVPGAARAGVAWIAKSLGFVGRRLVNLRGRVEAGTTEALEGGRSKDGRAGWEWWLDDARASLKRLLAGVALT